MTASSLALPDVATAHWWTLDRADLDALALVAQTNLAAGLAIDDEYVVRVVDGLLVPACHAVGRQNP